MLKTMHLTLTLLLTATAATFVGCAGDADYDGSYLLDEESATKSDIKLKAIIPESNGQALPQKIDVLVSSSAAFDTLILCEDDDPGACRQGATQYERLSKLEMKELGTERSFYLVEDLSVKPGMALAFAAFKASDPKTAEGRVVEVTEAGLFTLPEAKRSSGGAGGNKDQTGSPAPSHTFEGLTSIYRVWAPADNSAQQAHPLVVFFHGDTGSNFGPTFLAPDRISAQYAAHGHQQLPTLDQARAEGKADPKSMWNQMIFVSILSPTTNGSFYTWNTSLSNDQKNALADFSHNLLQAKILKEYNVNMDHVYLVGQSGGANFVSNTMVPRHGRNYQGGAVMLCAGEPPRQDLGFTPDAVMKASYKMHYETTNNEDAGLLPKITSSHDAYQKIFGQASVIHRKVGDGGHCFFRKADQTPRTQPHVLDEVIRKMLKDKKSTTSNSTTNTTTNTSSTTPGTAPGTSTNP